MEPTPKPTMPTRNCRLSSADAAALAKGGLTHTTRLTKISRGSPTLGLRAQLKSVKDAAMVQKKGIALRVVHVLLPYGKDTIKIS